MKKHDPSIGYRAYEEVLRLFPSIKQGALVIGCGKNVVYDWHCGMSPTAVYLARLYELGADVIYILTGKKNKEG